MTAPCIHLKGAAWFDTTPLFGPLEIDCVAGGWTCLLGPSGCGKTTILRLLAGLETGVRFEGSIATDDAAPLASRIAYMAQSDLLLPWLDVIGNVTLGAALRGEHSDQNRAEEMIARVGLSEHAHKRPAQLSGGQRQRVALARTLMEDRPVVLLDEPFSALDARRRADLQEVAAETLAGRTVLLVTHDPAEAARLGDRVYVMDRGEVTAPPVPDSPAIRPVDAPEVLRFQAALLAQLRESA